MKIYLADYKYNKENITECEVEEKAKVYKVISSKDLTGWCLTNRQIHKDDSRICKTLREAFEKIEAEAKEHLEYCVKEYQEALEKYSVIHEVTSAIRLDPSKIDKALKELRDLK